MAWTLILNRLPTRSNLAIRDIIPQSGNQNCPLCDGTLEIASYLFRECGKASDIWYSCYNWLGVSYVCQNQISSHFESTVGIFYGKMGGLLAIGLQISIVWTLWKNKNKQIFEGKCFDVESTIKEIQGRLWSWILVNSSFSNFTFVEWLSYPTKILD